MNEIALGQDRGVDDPDLPHEIRNHPNGHDQEIDDRTQRNVSTDLVQGLDARDHGTIATGHDLNPDPKVKDTRRIKNHGGDQIHEIVLKCYIFKSHL